MTKCVAFIDHFDSFSFNVLDWLAAGLDSMAAGTIALRRIPVNDAAALADLLESPMPVVLSPGPGNPRDEISSLALCRSFAGKVPILGICLGHQILGLASGWSITRAASPFHGSRIRIVTDPGSRAFSGQSAFFAATYNSLVIRPPEKSVLLNLAGESQRSPVAPGWLRVAARCSSGDVQAVESSFGPDTVGVQFHPESFLSDDLSAFRNRWLSAAVLWEGIKPLPMHPC